MSNVIDSLAHERLRKNFRRLMLVLLLLLAAFAGYFIYQQLRPKPAVDNQTVADMLHKLDSMSNLAKTFENQKGQLVTDNVALIAKNEGILQEMSKTVFSLKDEQERMVKKITYLTVVKQQVRYDSVFLRYDTSRHIPLVAEGRSDSIGVPQFFSQTDSMSGVFGRVLKTGVSLDSVWVNNNVWLRHGVRKKGFLNLGREDFVQAMNTNPMVRTTGLGTVTYRQKPNAWNRWIKPTLTFVVGVGLTYEVMK